jgi:hypothetical protein
VVVSKCQLLPDVTGRLRRYKVTVTLWRADEGDTLLPQDGQAAAELAAAGVAAEDLMTAWTRTRFVVSMIVTQPDATGAISAGALVARCLGDVEHLASVMAEPASG